MISAESANLAEVRLTLDVGCTEIVSGVQILFRGVRTGRGWCHGCELVRAGPPSRP